MTHTPGPWRVNPDNDTELMCGEYIGADFYFQDGKKREAADAALLASAAPELLAALQVIVSVLPSALPGENEAYVLEKARAAIAKATGEPC